MATGPKAGRTLWLLRHAKTVTDPPPGGDDFDRVLAPRGRRDAKALGRLFAGAGEGLGPALESAHAVAECIRLAPKLAKDDVLVVNLSGRGDKDMGIMARELQLAGAAHAD